jgi:uncharacterized protein (DUF362 family)
MKSKVAYKIIEGERKEDLFKTVEKAMELAEWKKHIKGDKVFIKINALSDQVVPGQCTSPWFLEAVLEVLKDFKIAVGDADVATARQIERAAEVWGYKKICARRGVKFVNLSKEKTTDVNVDGFMFKKIKIPKLIVEADAVITLPVLKTHNVAKMTFALKNQWGCIPRFRQQYHMHLKYCIPDLNRALKVDFAVGDATICLEDNGPRTGKPRICNSIFASNDLVAIDSAASGFIGIKDIDYLKYSKKLGLGMEDYELVGDKMVPCKFKPAVASRHPIVGVELFLRKIPVARELIFKTPLFYIPAFFASKYNSFVWYNLKGKKYARDVIKNNKLYYDEFKDIIK